MKPTMIWSREVAMKGVELHLRYRPNFFSKLGTKPHMHLLEISIFFSKSCHHQTYQNYEQPTQRLQISLLSIKNQWNISDFFFL